MKTKILNIAIAAVLSFSTLSVSADDTKGKKVSSEKKNNSVTSIISSVKEAEMELESWMTSLKEFNKKSETFTDSPLELEEWMMEDFIVTNETENFQESEIILEDWMLKSFDAETQEMFIDEELVLESWMLEIL